MASSLDVTELKKKAQEQFKMLQERPEMVISLLAVILLVVGVFSAVLLSGVEQDIRQQAAMSKYHVGAEEKNTVREDLIEGKPAVNAGGTLCTSDSCEVWVLE